MIVPEFWAEGRVQERAAGRQVTVRRFGWSDTSAAEAQHMADERARQALGRILSGDKLPRRELKRAYNGSEGVPIREEVVRREGDAVITRNGYGALCLNTPNVLFADIDFSFAPSRRLVLSVLVASLIGAVAAGWYGRSWAIGLIATFAALAHTIVVSWILQRLLVGLAGGPERYARRRIERYLGSHPDWHVRLYRTPSGLRALALHQAFDPHDPLVAEFFQAVGADPIYVRMCLRQRCFRARVSPKPWRVGIASHMKPRPGVWPIAADRLPERQRWIAEYEQASRGYAACRFLEALGSGRVHPAATAVQQLHDELSHANQPLPLA